ncbi:MAG: hypothetical protein JWM41_302 [Gemmatimonadetes bacterium]|jgi:hypothetical protein|nr:hypothetical protein [Gemmatimonadota bacterium]
MQRITRFFAGSALGTALAFCALSVAPNRAGAQEEIAADSDSSLTCVETTNYVCCESSTGKVTCMKK